MKRILFVLLATVLLTMTFAYSALGGWNVEGISVITTYYYPHPEIYPHTSILVQEGTSITGGSLILPDEPHWPKTIDSGSVIGNEIIINAHYTDNPGEEYLLVGTIAPDGSMSGNWYDSYFGPSRTGTWASTSGKAVTTQIIVMYLKDDTGLGLAGEDITIQPAYGGSWGPKYYGTTDTNGAFAIEDMEEDYTKIRMTFNQASVQQTVSELDASGYTWTAVPLTIQFQNNMGVGLSDGKVDQGGGTWVHHGYTDAAGQFGLHVFPQKQYKFRVGYPYTSETKWFNVPGPGSHTEVFQTVSATLAVLDYTGSGLANVKVDQGGGSWVHHGYTDVNGEFDLQLFGGKDYKFKVSGDAVSNSSQRAWFAIPGLIEFQAGYVVSAGTAIKASIGGRWLTYSSPGMHILPGTYKFVFAAPIPSPQWITVTAGQTTNID